MYMGKEGRNALYLHIEQRKVREEELEESRATRAPSVLSDSPTPNRIHLAQVLGILVRSPNTELARDEREEKKNEQHITIR